MNDSRRVARMRAPRSNPCRREERMDCFVACAPLRKRFAFVAGYDGWMRQNNATGKSILITGNRVKSRNQKYFCFSEFKSGVWSARLTRQEGRAHVTNARWDAVDADVATDDRD